MQDHAAVNAVRQVTLIVGPPGAGKSTMAAGLGVPHLEREQFRSSEAFRASAERMARSSTARLVVVRCCASVAEQARWVALLRPTRVVVLDTPMDVCRQRIISRGRPKWRNELAGAEWWWRQRGRLQVPKSAAVDHYAGAYKVRARAVVRAANANRSTRCWRCGLTLEQARVREPSRRITWQAGHTIDGDSRFPILAEHSLCNLRAGQVLSTAKTLRTSRRWR